MEVNNSPPVLKSKGIRVVLDVMKKKAQSQIVTAVILIFIVITLSIIILNFTVPFVKDRLSGTGCLDVVGQVSFTNNPSYTCLDDKSDPKEIRLQVHVGDVEELLGFTITMDSDGSSESYEIKNDSKNINIKIFTIDDSHKYNDALRIPGKNLEITYVIKRSIADSIKIYPLLKDGNVCDFTDAIESLGSCR